MNLEVSFCETLWNLYKINVTICTTRVVFAKKITPWKKTYERFDRTFVAKQRNPFKSAGAILSLFLCGLYLACISFPRQTIATNSKARPDYRRNLFLLTPDLVRAGRFCPEAWSGGHRLLHCDHLSSSKARAC
jgi:hypothetical protein